MSMTLIDHRIRLGIASRDAMDPSYYPNAFLDEALDRLFARFLRSTRVITISDTVSFTTADNEADFSALVAFMPSRIKSMRIDVDANYTKIYRDLEDVGIATVEDYLACESSSNASTPCKIGFADSVTAKMFPAPQHDGTLTVRYWPLQVPWTLGTMGAWSSTVNYKPGDVVSDTGNLFRAIISSLNVATSTAASWQALGAGTLVAPGSIVSVIPDGLMSELIGIGGPPHLQFRDPEHTEACAADWQRYLDFERDCMGIGSQEGRVLVRERLSRRGRGC